MKQYCCYIPDVDLGPVEVDDNEGLETKWEMFCRVHDIFGIFLMNSGGYNRIKRLIVLYCMLIGQLWILGAFFGTSDEYDDDDDSDDDKFNPEKVKEKFGWQEISYIIFSFLLVSFPVLIIRFSLRTSQYSTYVDSEDFVHFR
jgi:hypothetical protein